jgi:O-antigen/teichoic acid export membrane protein
MNMVLNVKKFFSSELIKVSSLNAVATLIRMLTGFISVKVVASLIGPQGIAVLGQLSNFSSILLSISSGGINAGITKYVSEYSDNKDFYTRFLGTGLWITLALSFICSLILIFGAGYFSTEILHDVKYKLVFYIFGVTIILYALNALLISVINGFRDFKKYVIANILGSIIGLIFSITLAIKFGILGALIASVTYQSVLFFLTIFIVSKAHWFNYRAFIKKFDRGTAKKLANYSLMAISSALTVPGGQLVVRNFIIDNRSISEAGIWEGMNRISGMYLTIITTSLSVYFLPKLAQLKSDKEFRDEIFNAFKLIFPFLIISTLGIFLFRNLIIQILFTKDFSSMQDLFGVQLIGDFLKLTGWVLGYILLAKAMTKMYIILELFNFFLVVLSSYFLIKMFGTIGATMAYTFVYFVYLILLIILFRKILFKSV